MVGAGTGAMAGSFFSDTETRQSRGASPQKARRENTSSSMGQKAGSAIGAVLDTKNKFKDKASAVKENIKDMPCLLYTSPSPRDGLLSRMPSSA